MNVIDQTGRVFISYAQQDRGIAEAIGRALESRGHRCWIAPRDIAPGSDWAEQIVGAIQSARLMVLVFSPASNASPQVRREVERAVARDLPVVPFRIRDTVPTGSLEYFLGTSQWFDAFAGPIDAQIERLATFVDEPTSLPGPVARSEPPRAATNSARRRWLVAAGTGAATAAAGGWWWWHQAGSTPDLVRIAVLPFEDRSAAHLEQATADGLANDVIHRFEGVGRVHVLARNSAFTFRATPDQSALLSAVREQLNADYALIGALTRALARVRVDVQLFKLPSGAAIWTSAFEEPDARLADLPGAIAGGTLKALRLPEPKAPETNPLDAYELYLLGSNALQVQRTIEGIRKAREHFEHAIATDPGYARAYAGLANTWIAQALYGVGVDWVEVNTRAQPLIDKALSIDPDLLEGLLAQGKLFLLTRWNEIVRGRTFVQKAVDLYPGSAEARFDLGVSYAYDAQPTMAIPHYAAALALDPLNYLIHSRWGQDATFSGDYEAARTHFARAGTLMPKYPWRFLGPGQTDYARGRLDDAVANYRLQLEQDPRRPDVWDELGWFYLDLGMTTEARAAFAKKTSFHGNAIVAALDEAQVLLVDGGLDRLPAMLDAAGLEQPTGGVAEIERLRVRAIAGRAPSSSAIGSIVAAMRADASPWIGSYWVFLGRMVSIDLAALYDRIDARDAARALLDESQAMLDRLRTRGNVFHTIPFLEARIAALRGQGESAVGLLERAVDMGWKRVWVLPFDLAFTRIASDRRIARADRAGPRRP